MLACNQTCPHSRFPTKSWLCSRTDSKTWMQLLGFPVPGDEAACPSRLQGRIQAAGQRPCQTSDIVPSLGEPKLRQIAA